MSIVKSISFTVAGVVLMASSACAEVGVRLEYGNPGDAAEQAVREELIASGVMKTGVAFIDDHFKLAEPLVITLGGDDGPLFDGESPSIMIPYTFVDEVRRRFEQADYDKTGVMPEQATDDALLHTLFHEFAHALIYMYQLPILGKEEDAADALATVLLIEFFDDGQEIALSAADLFNLESDDRDVLEDEDFWDEHSLDDQRYFTTLCHVYGSAPDKYVAIVKEGLLGEERAELCIEEYGAISNSWLSILEPYIKP
ncbi:DUF4344 domain-containing metallopeptidase [Shewanella insulae]|uniref:DUF4344 domain-containing metallopeptidase n=1 Tax=Shewanella insulae TaxID=2681496 RepID=UPI001EFDA63E|nr:DUF4344 domain-containing metallopeptidase [Shewanella insulae]MCG9756227.1 DUF4344 domain-containing metallopeptidase [Shewanella insulae]